MWEKERRQFLISCGCRHHRKIQAGGGGERWLLACWFLYWRRRRPFSYSSRVVRALMRTARSFFFFFFFWPVALDQSKNTTRAVPAIFPRPRPPLAYSSLCTCTTTTTTTKTKILLLLLMLMLVYCCLILIHNRLLLSFFLFLTFWEILVEFQPSRGKVVFVRTVGESAGSKNIASQQADKRKTCAPVSNEQQSHWGKERTGERERESDYLIVFNCILATDSVSNRSE